MKKLALALLIPITCWMSSPGALAEDLTPTSIAIASETNSFSEDSRLKASVPVVEDGNMAKGVDIVNQSLKYHSSVNPQIPTQNSIQSSMMRPQGQMALNGNIRQNNFRNMQPMRPMANQQQYGYMPRNNFMPNGNAMYPMQGQTPPMMPQISGETMKKAIGVAGTAALVGVFVKSGGLGGLTKSLGWDNRRYMRGQHY